MKKPYILSQWKRPLLNKIASASICILYVAAALTTADSTINQFLPLAILLLLVVVVSVGIASSIYELHDYWSARE